MAIHPSAVVHPKAEIDPSVDVGPFTVIDEHVRVGADCVIGPNAYLTGWTNIERQCRIHFGAVVGHEPQDVKYGGERSFCTVGEGTIIREHVTIHRGTIPESTTTIGARCFFLAGSHVAHNCELGVGVTLINNAMLAGHVSVGDGAVFGGGAGAHQFARIGELAMIAGNAGIGLDIPPFVMTDREGRVAGLNRVGMARSDLTKEEITDVREAFRLWYGSRKGKPFLPETVTAAVCTDAGRRFAAFVTGTSRRGVAGRARRRSRADPSGSPATSEKT